MHEIGIDFSVHRSKNATGELSDLQLDCVVAMSEEAYKLCNKAKLLRSKVAYRPFEEPSLCPGSEEERLGSHSKVRD